LSSLSEEEQLIEYEAKLIDRFGPLPTEVQELILSLRLRWIGKTLGFQRISLKNENLTGYFPPQENPYFQSTTFGKVLEYFKKNHKNCEMKELKGKLIFRMNNVNSISQAIEKANSILIA
jgi:transcription-repair coupling factor (superfamily II helicase)